MRRQNIVVFSSGKNIKIAEEVCKVFEDNENIQAILWKQLFKDNYTEEYSARKSYPLFHFLVKRIPLFDFAIIVAGDDDVTTKDAIAIKRDNEFIKVLKESSQDFVTTRDNVVFE